MKIKLHKDDLFYAAGRTMIVYGRIWKGVGNYIRECGGMLVTDGYDLLDHANELRRKRLHKEGERMQNIALKLAAYRG